MLPEGSDGTGRGAAPTSMNPRCEAGFHSAPRETRTPTPHTRDKALNLARLPIPPQALAAADYRSGRLRRQGLDWRPPGSLLCEHTFETGYQEDSPRGPQAHKAAAGDIRVHQAVLRAARLSAHGSRHRKGDRAHVAVHCPRAPHEPGEGRAAAPGSVPAARLRTAGRYDASRLRSV